MEKLAEIHIKFRLNENTHGIIEGFWWHWKFPNCIGYINGKHICIKAPLHSGNLHHNYRPFFSIVLQDVVGPDYRFIAIQVGAYGKTSDGEYSRNQICQECYKTQCYFSETITWNWTFFISHTGRWDKASL